MSVSLSSAVARPWSTRLSCRTVVDRSLLLACVLSTIGCGAGRGTSSPPPAAAVVPVAADPEPRVAAELSLTLVGNAGFVLRFPDGEGGTIDVLVDAVLGEGLPEYPVPAPETREAIERGLPPFDHVSLVLATHVHPDHFDPRAAARMLANAPSLRLITTDQARRFMEKVDPEGFAAVADRVEGLQPSEDEPIERRLGALTVRAFAMHHGRDRDPPIENLGFLISAGGIRAFHVGDAMLSNEELAALPLGEGDVPVEVVLVPYWHLFDGGWGPTLIERLRPTHVVAMHLPVPDVPADYFGSAGSLAGLVGALRDGEPAAVVLEELGEERSLPLTP